MTVPEGTQTGRQGDGAGIKGTVPVAWLVAAADIRLDAKLL